MTMLLLAVMGSAWADSYTLGWGTANGDEGTYTNFTANSGNVNGIVSFTTEKNSSQNPPAYNSNSKELRIYYASNGNGGSVTLTPVSGVTITGFEMTTSTTPSVKYIVDGETNSTISASNNTYTVSGISATSSLKIQNANATNTQLRILTIKITYTAYTITAQSNNTDFGTVSLNGNVITGSPKSGCRYAAPAYIVSPANSATVTQDGNIFTVTPTANTTVTINFEAIPIYTVTLGDDNSSLTEAIGGAGVTLPTRDALDDDYIEFVGWSETNVSTETTTAPSIISVGDYYPTANMTLYPVYTKTVGGAAEPSAFTVGSTGDYAIVSAPQDGKYYALPTNPTVSSGKITAQEITVSEKNGVKYVETTNASGFTWTIASATNGYTLYDGNNYIYHSNGGYSGTDLAYGPSTNYTWVFTIDDDYVKMKTIGGTADRDRGMLFSGTTIGGYSLTNWDNSGYNKTMLLPIVEIGTAYYWSGLPAYEIVDFTTAGYKTYVTQNAIDWTATEAKGVEGYQVTDLSKTSVTLQKLGEGLITVANTPVILKGKEGVNLLVIASDEGFDISSTNLLKRGSERNESEKNFMYVLQKSNNWSKENPYDEYNFYPLRPSRWNDIGDRQAYLVLATAPGGGDIGGETGGPGFGVKPIPITFINANDDEPLVSDDAGLVDGINEIQHNEALEGEFYSISGVRVAAPTKGLYIVNGKKVLVK